MFTTHPGPRATLLTCLFALPLVAPGPCGGRVDTYDLGVGAFEVDHDGALLWTHVVPVDPATNVVPLKVNDRQLRPIGQLQFLLAPGCSEAEIEKVVHQMGLFLADRGCFALTLVDMGMIPRGVLESLGFSPTEGLITFAARGPKSTIAAFDGLSPPFFVDFM